MIESILNAPDPSLFQIVFYSCMILAALGMVLNGICYLIYLIVTPLDKINEDRIEEMKW